MFNIEEHKQFIKTKIVSLGNRKASLTEREVIDSLCLFDRPSYTASNKKPNQYSEQIRRIFGDNLREKHKNEQVRDFFLRIRSFKHCSKCNLVKLHDLFRKDNSRIDGLAAYCKDCANTYIQSNKSNVTTKFHSLTSKLSSLFEHPFVLDHKISRSNGGNDTVFNLQILTQEENWVKGNKDHIIVNPILTTEDLVKFDKNLVSENELIDLAKIRFKNYLVNKVNKLDGTQRSRT
jgi:5-methylcytosine-specific restriction endonuclease McrA